MTLKAIFGRRWLRALGFAGAAVAGYAFGITADRATAQPVADKGVVAYITSNNTLVPVTREELGEFLIARGGHEKLELLVNKKIIQIEAARRNITVTPEEVQSGLNEDLRGMGITKADFVKHVLPRYNKSLYEWTEDVIKPRILLGKMCRDRVKVTEDDLRKAFENRHGERRQARVICWSNEDEKAAMKQWDEARKSDEDFLRVAKTQADPSLASSGGLVAPIGRHSDDPKDQCRKVLFTLKQGELSQLFQTEAGIMCVKCVTIISPDANVKLEGELRAALEKEVFDKKMTAEIPVFFNDCKKQAKPNLLLKGPPSPAEIREDVIRGVQQTTGGNVPGTPPPGPAPKGM